jgi:hypothetical protein
MLCCAAAPPPFVLVCAPRYGLINATRLPGSQGLERLTDLLHSCKHDLARTGGTGGRAHHTY